MSSEGKSLLCASQSVGREPCAQQFGVQVLSGFSSFSGLGGPLAEVVCHIGVGLSIGNVCFSGFGVRWFMCRPKFTYRRRFECRRGFKCDQ